MVVPWSPRLFQYTVKDVARPAVGRLWVDGVEHAVPAGESWAVLDHGRGRWPYSMHWNWGAGSGVVDGRVIGLQVGGRWTDGTGSTENALVVDGRVHKVSEELAWDYDPADWLAPWRVRGELADLTFTPFWDHASSTNLGVLAQRADQCFGHWTGWMSDDAGERVAVDGILGLGGGRPEPVVTNRPQAEDDSSPRAVSSSRSRGSVRRSGWMPRLSA